MHARILAFLVLLFCTPAATILAASPPTPTRIPGSPEEAMLNVYQRLTALEQQVKSLQQQVAAQQARDVEQTARLKAIMGEVAKIRRVRKRASRSASTQMPIPDKSCCATSPDGDSRPWQSSP